MLKGLLLQGPCSRSCYVKTNRDPGLEPESDKSADEHLVAAATEAEESDDPDYAIDEGVIDVPEFKADARSRAGGQPRLRAAPAVLPRAVRLRYSAPGCPAGFVALPVGASGLVPSFRDLLNHHCAYWYLRTYK